jgi:hypothetical protein
MPEHRNLDTASYAPDIVFVLLHFVDRNEPAAQEFVAACFADGSLLIDPDGRVTVGEDCPAHDRDGAECLAIELSWSASAQPYVNHYLERMTPQLVRR